MSTIGMQEVLCVNDECRKKIGERVKFCPYCRTLQPLKEAPSEPEPGFEGAFAHDAGPGASKNSGTTYVGVRDVVLRASSGVWDFTEREQSVVVGQSRPLLVLDEQTVHLSHTDRKLDIHELVQRVRSIIDTNDVPVSVQQGSACWQSDRGEVRSRIIASLKDHAYSDYKMIFGVDYMGRWASIKMYLAFEPPIIPKKNSPAEKMVFMPWVTFVLLGFGFLAFVYSMSGYTGQSFGFQIIILTLIVSVFLFNFEHNVFKRKKSEHIEKIEREDRKRREEIESASRNKNLLRTYKIDDMRLFASAMEAVFQAVVDDIVQKDGAKVERIEGGKGGFLTEEGITSIMPAQRQSDAKALGL